MKKLTIYGFAVIMVISLILPGCKSVKNANRTQKGAGIGVAAGALIGGLIGNYAGKGGNAI